MMKFKFDAKQQYQLEGIQAVVDLFDGQPLNKGSFELTVEESFMNVTQALTYLGIGNKITLMENEINDNLNKIQRRNNITRRTDIETQGMNFAVEMGNGAPARPMSICAPFLN